MHGTELPITYMSSTKRRNAYHNKPAIYNVDVDFSPLLFHVLLFHVCPVTPGTLTDTDPVLDHSIIEN